MTDNETAGKEGLGKVGTQAKDGIIGCLKGINEIEAEIVTPCKKHDFKYLSDNRRNDPRGC